MDCLFGETTPLTRRFRPALMLVLILSGGCGGGGGEGGSAPSTPLPPPPDTTPPVFSGVDDTTIDRGEAFDPLEGVSATDNVDGSVTSSIMTTGAVDVSLPGAYTVTYSVTDAARNTATAERVVTVAVPPGLPDVDTEEVFSDYFDIASGSPAGSEAIGKINLARNRNASASPIPDDYSFDIIEDDSDGLFELRAERDSGGRLFGVFTVADGNTAQAGDYALRVELRRGADVLARFSAPIAVAERTQWAVYHERVVDFVSRTRRLTGRQDYTDAQVADTIAELEAANGAFDGLDFYAASTEADRAAIGTDALSDELEDAANRIGGLGQGLFEKLHLRALGAGCRQGPAA